MPVDNAWLIEIWNPRQSEWNLYSSVSLRKVMADMTLEEAIDVIRKYRRRLGSHPPSERAHFMEKENNRVMRLRNAVTQEEIPVDILQ